LNRNTRQFLDLILVLTQKDLKVRYKNSVLGYLWSVANPLAFALVFYFAFKVIMRVDMEDYALFLIVGLFPWQWFSNSINISSTVFLSNASIIKKVSFPRNIIPLSIVLQDMIHYILSLPVIGLFLLLYQKPAQAAWLWGIPLLLAGQFMLIYGLALAVSSINLFFRDLERIVGILMMIVFYCTPILYPLDMIPARFQHWVGLNPFATAILGWRTLLLDGRLDPVAAGLTLAYGLAALGLGTWIYSRLAWKFAEVL